jgi:hypothetical protein
VVVKVKPHSDNVTEVGEAVARLCDARVGAAYARWPDRIGFAGSHLRERALYECGDSRLTRHMPALLGVADLDTRGGCVLLLVHGEEVRAVRGDTIRAYGKVAGGRDRRRQISPSCTALLRAGPRRCAAPWIGFCQSAASMREMGDLWSPLADHAAPAFAEWERCALPAQHRQLVDAVDEWWPVLSRGPQTLLHHDFNPRNLCLRETPDGLALCAYDWELATIGAPQRDLAEFLCFVLPADVSDATIDTWIERHRAAFERAAGEATDPAQWRRGFHAAMDDLLVNRLAMRARPPRAPPALPPARRRLLGTNQARAATLAVR